MASDVFVDGQPLSTSDLNAMYTRLLQLESAEQKRNATVVNTTGTVTYETRMHAVKTKPLKAGPKHKTSNISFENAKFPDGSTVIYTVTPEWNDIEPNATVYWKINESDTKGLNLTYWTTKVELTVYWNVIAVALIPKT